jgi:hypothetical protein
VSMTQLAVGPTTDRQAVASHAGDLNVALGEARSHRRLRVADCFVFTGLTYQWMATRQDWRRLRRQGNSWTLEGTDFTFGVPVRESLRSFLKPGWGLER